MTRFLTTTTALSLALAPFGPAGLAHAQVSVETPLGVAVCLTDATQVCPEAEVCILAPTGDCAAEGVLPVAEAALAAAAAAEAEAAAAAAEAEAKGAADAAAAAEAEAAAAAEAEAAAAAEAEAKAAAELAATAEEEAKAKAASEAAAAAEAKAAAEAAAAAAAEAEAKAAAEVAATAEEEAKAKAAAEAEASAAAEAEASAAAEADAKAKAAAAAEAAEADAKSKAEADAAEAADAKPAAEAVPAVEPAPATASAPETVPETVPVPEASPAPDTATVTAPDTPVTSETATPPVTAAAPDTAPDAATVTAPAPVVAPAPVDAPEVLGDAAEALQTLLTGTDSAETAPVAAAAEVVAPGTADAGVPAPSPDAVAQTETEITATDTRSSGQEFAAAPVVVEGNRRSGLSDLEKFGLVALGALVVGSVLANGDEVVSNSGDRVVVRDDSGDFRVLKDDDTLLRRPGSKLRTETFNDGSTRTILDREDGSSIVTIRDASGRVLRRVRYGDDGSEILLIDDLQPVELVDVRTLPAPRYETTISASDDGASLAAAVAAIRDRENARSFSLRQIRDLREVRALAPTIDVDNITFRSGSAAIEATEAEKLAQLGGLIASVVRERPYEVFLIEGHTDAVGSGSSNLALSDRRAESVALALTEYFAVPPENLVVQGYGEGELRVPTTASEQRNRRVAVRLISPLMQNAALR